MDEFDWDEANIKHLAAHRVTPVEFEQALKLDAYGVGFEIVNAEERYSAVGPTATGRLLYLVYTVRGERVCAVTACDAGVSLKKEWMDRP